MKVIKIDLSKELSSLEVHTFADLHIGDQHCDLDLIKRRIKYVEDNPNAYCILNGDLCDNATKDSIGDTHGEVYSPQEQIDVVCDLFQSVKDKIICINTGTHEIRTYKRSGIDITAIIAERLDVLDKYSSTASLIFVRFGNIRNGRRQRCFTIYCLHGVRSGRKVGSKAVALQDMGGIINSDIVIHSHSHAPITFKDVIFQVDAHNSNVYEKEVTYINTASMLDYGGYGCYGEYKPSSKTSPVIHLHEDDRKVRVVL